LLPVVSPPPFPVDWPDGLLALSFDDPVNRREAGRRRHVEIIDHPKAGKRDAASDQDGGKGDDQSAEKASDAANTCMPAAQSCLAATYKA